MADPMKSGAAPNLRKSMNSRTGTRVRSVRWSAQSVLKLAFAVSTGVAGWGWIVATIPCKYSVAVAFERPTPRSEADSQPSKDTLIDDLLGEASLSEVVRNEPVAESEQLGDHPPLALRARTEVCVASLDPTRERVVVRVHCSQPTVSERIGRAIVDQYLSFRIAPPVADTSKVRLADAEARLLRSAKSLSDAQADLQRLQLQASQQATARNVAVELAKLRNAIEVAHRRRSMVVQASYQPERPVADNMEPGQFERADASTMAHQSLREMWRQRSELVATFSDKHPAARGLDRKIAELAQVIGIVDVHDWINSQAESRPSADRSERMDSAIQQAKALDAEIAELQQREGELVLAAKVDTADGVNEALARQFELVTRLQAEWHEALADKHRCLQAAKAVPVKHDVEFRRCPGMQQDVRCESPNRRAWFAIGSGIWTLVCGLVCVGSRRGRRLLNN